jgi:hypothetical protein
VSFPVVEALKPQGFKAQRMLMSEQRDVSSLPHTSAVFQLCYKPQRREAMENQKKAKFLKKFVMMMFILLFGVAVGTFIYSCFKGGSILKFAITFSSSILAYNSYLVMKIAKKKL